MKSRKIDLLLDMVETIKWALAINLRHNYPDRESGPRLSRGNSGPTPQTSFPQSAASPDVHGSPVVGDRSSRRPASVGDNLKPGPNLLTEKGFGVLPDQIFGKQGKLGQRPTTRGLFLFQRANGGYHPISPSAKLHLSTPILR